jgi:hypothetical protein
MEHLPPDFERQVARLVAAGDEAEVARVIRAATALDDERLRVFLELFGERVRDSADPLRGRELERLLRVARDGPPPDEP